MAAGPLNRLHLHDPAEMEHEVQLATHQQCARGQDDKSLIKLLQNNALVLCGKWLQFCKGTQ